MLLLLLLLLPPFVLGSAVSDFDAWARAHGRTYASAAERAERLALFRANLNAMEIAARHSPLATFGPDAFSDYSEEEWKALRGANTVRGLDNTKVIPRVHYTPAEIQAALDAPIDWVALGKVTKPTSQGRCATCAYFAGVAATESAWAIAGHPLVKLSEQEEIDCYNNAVYSMANIVAHGIAKIEDAPLANHSDPNITGCRHVTNCARAESKAFAFIDGYRSPASHNDSYILPMLRHGPIAVSIDAGPYNGYHGGILNCSASPPFHHVDHANTLVGYGVEPPPRLCGAQPPNHTAYKTYCATGWTGRPLPPPTKRSVRDVEECCAACAEIVGNGTSEAPACGAAVFSSLDGSCSLVATAPTDHALPGMPKPDVDAVTTCIPLSRSTVPTSGIPYWKLKNSWGPEFGEGGYARLLFGNNCIRGAVQPYINQSTIDERMAVE